MSDSSKMVQAILEALEQHRMVAWLRGAEIFRAGRFVICAGFVGVAS